MPYSSHSLHFRSLTVRNVWWEKVWCACPPLPVVCYSEMYTPAKVRMNVVCGICLIQPSMCFLSLIYFTLEIDEGRKKGREWKKFFYVFSKQHISILIYYCMFSIMQYVYFTQYVKCIKSYNNQRSYTETKRLTTKTCSIQYCAQDSAIP